MALALSHFLLIFNVIGAKDRTRTRQFEILSVGGDDATKRTNAQAEAALILSTWATVSNTHVQSYRLSEVWFDAASTPTGLYNPYEEVTVTAHLDVGGGKKHTINIMGPDDTIFVADSPNTQEVDTADAGLVAFLARFKNDGTALGAVSDGEQFGDPTNIVGSNTRTVRGAD